MNYWKVILATVVIFGAGVITGGLLVNFVQHPHSRLAHHVETHSASANPSQHLEDVHKLHPPEILHEGFLKELDDDLRLAPDQLDTIKKILADGQAQNHNIWTNSLSQMRKVMQDTRRQIREQLTPDQQKQFEDMLKQFRAPHHSQSITNTPPV